MLNLSLNSLLEVFKMAKPTKQRSRILEKASARLGAMRSLGTDIDFGNGLSFTNFEESIAMTREALLAYNAAIATYSQAKLAFMELERNLADVAERMLTGVATQYGKQSHQYEMAGGTRKGARRRRRKAQEEVANTPV
jgi:hypothetical protein